MTFGEWIKNKRRDKGQVRPKAAKEIGVCPSTLQNWERDLAFPRSLASLRGIIAWSGDLEGFCALLEPGEG